MDPHKASPALLLLGSVDCLHRTIVGNDAGYLLVSR